MEEQPRSRRETWRLLFLLSPSLFWLVVFFLVPLLLVLAISFGQRGTYGGVRWDLTLEKGLQMQIQGVHAHIVTSYYALPLMIERRQGLVAEITDGNSLEYRGRLFYDLAKVSAIRLAYAMSVDLRKYNIAVVALTPGYLRSEEMLDQFGVTEENWQDGVERDRGFENSETPYYIGRAVAALAADPNVMDKTGRALSSGYLARDYGFADVDGRQSIWYRGEGIFSKDGFVTQENE